MPNGKNMKLIKFPAYLFLVISPLFISGETCMSGDGHNPYYVHTKGNCINNGYLYIWSVRNCVEAAAFNQHLDNILLNKRISEKYK